jgi:tetratricopeptide (TPR) repeat protein
MTMKERVVTVVCAIMMMMGVYSNALSQCKEFLWPADKAKAEESVAVWGDAIKQGNYRQATPGLQWMLANAPKWNTKLYIDGVEIYDKLAEKETDPAKKKVLVDSLLMIYDMRIQNCGDEINVMNRKVYACYKYYKTKEKVAELLAMYDKIYETSGNNISDNNLVAYMTTIKNYQTLHKNLTDEQILQRYDKIMAVLDVKLKKAQEQSKQADIDKLKSYKDAVEGILISIVKVNCDFVRKNLVPKFKQNPNDLALAKKIFSFMLQDKCTDDPVWLEAGEKIHEMSTEKDFGLVKTLGSRYVMNGNLEKAEGLYKEALPLAPTPQDKSEIQTYLGGIESKKGNYVGARDLYRQAITTHSSNKEAYEKIGDLYYNSFDNCSKKQSLAEDRLVYLAAYEMYVKAGNNQLMARAKAQFPSREEIFLLNWQAGSNQKVGCWINETVILKTRD